MNLEEIEAKADEYAHHLTDTKSADQTRYYREKLEGLSHLAQIKRVADLRSEWNSHVGMREAEIDAMHKAANAAEAAIAQRTPREQAFPVSFNAEPTKPVADLNLPAYPKPEASPRCPATQFEAEEQLVYRCTRPAGHISRGIAHAWVGYPATVVDPEEPTKPVADRLHELVSVWKGYSREQDNKAGLVMSNSEQMGYHNGQAVGWGKAASMLEEILLEGGI